MQCIQLIFSPPFWIVYADITKGIEACDTMQGT